MLFRSPLPRALRLQLLDDLYAKGMLAPDEYRRRLPFAWTQNIQYPDEAHTARARRVVESMRQGQWLPLLWMDNEQIHKDVLERELLLPDDTPQQIRSMAFQRWMQLTGQQMMKQSGMMLPMGGAGAPQTPPSPGPQGPGQPGGQPLPPQGGSTMGSTPPQPMQNTNPAVKGGTYATLGGETDQNRLARDFDRQIQGKLPR